MTLVPAPAEIPVLPAAADRAVGPVRRVASALWRQRLARISGAVLLLMIVVAVLAPLVAPSDPLAQDLDASLASPSWSHPLGTDQLGRDILSRLIFGARLSLGAAAIAVAVATLLGVLPGLVAGYVGGWVDAVVMRITDALMSFPPLILALAITGVLGPGLGNAMVAVGVVFAPRFVRLARAAVIDIREADFVQAARSIGVSERAILGRHVLPNALGPLVVQVTVTAGFAMLAEASLSFLGLGVQPPEASWGSMIGEAARLISQTKLLVVWPGLAITITVLALGFLGDGLRQALGLEQGSGDDA
ncbi:MAG TPA: ABC transporter permease [Acidimicrobiales bacterium]|nr:ABC transporter permease [Acidimicrobiales bacterium]